MKLSGTSCFLTLLALFRTASSFSSGAGRCVVGEPGPQGFHAALTDGMGGSLANGNFMVEVNGSPVLPSDGTIVVPPDTDFDITVSGGDFKGFLIMLAGQAEGALFGNTADAQQAFGTNCGGTASMTHTSSAVKQSVTVTGNLPAGIITTMEVNVVVVNDGTSSVYHYDQFALEVGEPVTLPGTSPPTASPIDDIEAPTDSPVQETAGPTLAPTDAPVAPTDAPVAVTAAPVGEMVEPTTTPTSEPVADPTPNIVEVALATPELSTLVSFLTDDLVEALAGDGPFTLFAPTNDAFDKLPADVVAALMADEEALVDVLTYHVLGSVVVSADLTEGATVTALNGDNLTVTSLNPIRINGDSTVTVPDIGASNGVLHLIDTVLIPPEDEPETATPTASPDGETDVPPPFEPPEIVNYVAIIEPIPGVVSNVSGTVFVSTIGSGGTLFYGGFLSGLQPDLDGSDPECGAENGCGVHLHSGFGCEDNEAQGGHYFVDPITEDPWVNARYTSDGEGKATHGAILDIGTSDVVERVFLVHAQDGSRIGCGILKPRSSLPGFTEFEATTAPLESGQPDYPFVNGYVNVMVNAPAGDEATEQLCYVGYATGLMANIRSYLRGGDSCNVENGCGTHIHAGFSCEPEEQLGHWFSEELDVDPWLLLGYESTNEMGNAVFGDCAETGYPSLDAANRTFIVHGSDGSRVSCGVLQVLAGPPVNATPTASPIEAPTPAPVAETMAPSTFAPVIETVAPTTLAPVTQTAAPSTMAPVDETAIPTVTPTAEETGEPTFAPVAAPVPITDLVLATPELSTLASLLTDDVIAALSGDGPFTVFAPVDAAFDKLPADVVAALMDDEAALVDVLTYHVVGSVLSGNDLKVVSVATTLNGDDVIVTSSDPVVINGVATVIAADIAASNGVVHLIDTVLIPPEQEVPDVDEPCTGCPPLVVKGNNRRPIESWPLGVCEGDCDIDSDCEGDLVCFKEEGANTVPGCSGTRPTRPRDDNKVDYCYDPHPRNL